ncbi:MAG: hypothetical protein AAGA96_00735 [Verrucomicrobiota bacterium]
MSVRLFVVIPAVILFFGLTSVAFGQEYAQSDIDRVLEEADDLFRRANETALTDPGKAGKLYEQAAMRFDYLTTVETLNAGYVLANLGNTYFLGGDLGRAILSYRHALELLPGNEQIHASLSHAREQRVDVFESDERARWLEWVVFWHYKFSQPARLIIFALGWLGLWGLVVWRLFRGEDRKKIFRRGIIYCLAICLLTGLSFWVHARDRIGLLGTAVILQDGVEARKGDGYIYEPSFQSTLHAGTELKVLEIRGDWVKGEFGNGEFAWVPRETIGVVGQGG